jgi:hypothetical protein
MPWSWPSNNPRQLARYANPDAGLLLPELTVSTFDQKKKHPVEWARKVAEAIYNALCEQKIRYDLPKTDPSRQQEQIIRQPQEMIGGVGTCLDLAILFSSICLHKGLIPLLVVVEDGSGVGHAFVAVSKEFDLRNSQDSRRYLYGELSNADPAAPLFANQTALCQAVDLDKAGAYLPIECTGFALVESQATAAGRARVNGLLTFDDAVVAGRERIERSKLRYVVDLAIEKDLPSFSFEQFDLSLLGHAVWSKRRWLEWAERQPPTAPVSDVVPPDDRVASPLQERWREFIRTASWHDSMKVRCKQLEAGLGQARILDDDPDVNSFRAAIARIQWHAAYEKIRNDLRHAVRELHHALQRRMSEQQASSGVAWSDRATLEQCRKDSSRLDHDLTHPRYGRCFLVAGSHGSGKSFFVDSLLRRAKAASESHPFWIVVRVAVRELGVKLEQAILFEVERCFGIRSVSHLEDIDQRLGRANLRLVVVLEDLTDQFRDPAFSVDDLCEFIRSRTPLHSLRWLITLNDTGYDAVSRQADFWTHYGWTPEAESHDRDDEETLIHSGWCLLDRINCHARMGLLILKKYQQPNSHLALEFQQTQDLASRYIDSPLIASIVLTLSAETPERTLPGLNFSELIRRFAKILRQRNHDPLTADEVRSAITALAQHVGAVGSFVLRKSAVLERLGHAITRPGRESLESLHRMSLLLLEEAQEELFYTTPKMESKVFLLFELFWIHHLAEDIIREIGGQEVRVDELRELLEKRFRPLTDSVTRERVAEQLLLLSDSRPGYERAGALLWSILGESRELPRTAVFFAASKASTVRQKTVVADLMKKERRLLSQREVFGVMHLLAESDQIDLETCLTILRHRTPLGEERAFQRIKDLGLGDYFWFVFRRRHRAVDRLAVMPRCFSLLANCQILKVESNDVAANIAELGWNDLLRLANGKEEDIMTQMERYLLDDAEGAKEEYRYAHNEKPGSGKPHHLREHLLRHLYDWLLQGHKTEAYFLLQKRNWFPQEDPRVGKIKTSKKRPGKSQARKNAKEQRFMDQGNEPHRFIMEEMRRHWSLSAGGWFRWRANSDERGNYRDLTWRLLESANAEDWAVAYYMIRHTVQISDDKIAYVDDIFLPALSPHAKKVATFQNKHPVRFRS